MPRFRTPQQPPIVPNYVNYVYVGAHILSQYFSYAEHHILHGFFSVFPIFMILYILKNRLRKGGDLGSVMITLSFLAESFAHLLHQFTHVEGLFNIYFVEHFCCCVFYFFGNALYVIEPPQKKNSNYSDSQKFGRMIPPFMGILPIGLAAQTMLQFINTIDLSTSLYYGTVVYIIIMSLMLSLSLWRLNKTSSRIYGVIGSFSYYLSDVIYGAIRFQGLEVSHFHHALFSVLHKMGMLFQLHSSVAHIDWLNHKLKYN